MAGLSGNLGCRDCTDILPECRTSREFHSQAITGVSWTTSRFSNLLFLKKLSHVSQMLVILVKIIWSKGRFESQMRQICVRLGLRKLSVLNQVIG